MYLPTNAHIMRHNRWPPTPAPTHSLIKFTPPPSVFTRHGPYILLKPTMFVHPTLYIQFCTNHSQNVKNCACVQQRSVVHATVSHTSLFFSHLLHDTRIKMHACVTTHHHHHIKWNTHKISTFGKLITKQTIDSCYVCIVNNHPTAPRTCPFIIIGDLI